MSENTSGDLRTALRAMTTQRGGTPAGDSILAAVREVITACGGTPQSQTIVGALWELGQVLAGSTWAGEQTSGDWLAAIHTATIAQGGAVASQTVLGALWELLAVLGTGGPPMAGLGAWYQANTLGLADGAAVAAWPDSSGAGQTATQATAGLRPIYKTAIRNGKPVVRFDGVGTYLTVPDLSSGWGSGAGTAFLVLAGDGSRTTYEVLKQDNMGDSWWAHSGTAYPGLFRPVRVEAYPAVQPASGWRLWAVQSDTDYGMYINGALQAGGPAASWQTPTTLSIGGAPSDSLNRYLAGDIAEILIYKRAVTAGERAAVESYLNAKYALY